MEQTLISDLRSETIQADISGQVSGQVAVGNYNLQIGSVHGGVVNINMVESRPRLKPRQTPVRILPRSFEGLLDRVEVVGTASSVLPASQPVELYGEAGAGKTSLLRYLSHHSLTAAFPDGVIYLLGRGQASADLLQSIFTALFEYDAPYKPNEGEIRHALQGKRALIVIDDVELEREDVEGLMDAAPQSTFLLTSSTRLLWGQYHSIAVPGLPPDEAGLLFERELGRSLTAAEVQPVAELCESLGGHPLYIVQAASLAREGLQSLPSLIAAVRTRSPKEALAGLALRTTTPQERRVVAAIAALDGAPLHARHLPALTGLNDADPVLERLQRRGLIQAHSPRFTLTAGPDTWVQEYWNLLEWRLGLLEHFRTWLEGVQPEAELIAEESGPITRLVASAASLGYWRPALELARAAEAGLAHSLRWEAWRSVLEAGLQAAQTLGDLPAKALMLHQLGTRALCL
ncbi:MAG TPA: NB-ARC domain-containing protein, partial [Anaerolineales bacterium]|nr:NB-ARC domain-containing protein [Anaerolineales bacterium]